MIFFINPLAVTGYATKTKRKQRIMKSNNSENDSYMNFMKESKMSTYFDIMSLTEFLPLEEKIGSSDFEYLLVFSSSSLFQLSTRPEKFIRPSNGSKNSFSIQFKRKNDS